MTGRVEGKIAWVTGAGLGLGRESARRLAAEGAHVICADIDGTLAEEAAAEIGGRAVTQDVAKLGDWEAAAASIRENEGRLDVMVNNAGIAPIGTIESTTVEDWHRCMAVNSDGVFFGCRIAVGLMKENGAGSIINLSSIDGIIGESHLAAYCAAKGAVRTLTKAVAVHCGEQGYGIRCNSIHPGYIWTPQTEGYLDGLGVLEEERAKVLARHPIGRLGRPEDIANMVLYLASDESSFVTGAEMVVDGGYLMV